MRTHEPARRLDLMLTGALIEARSCERFVALAPHLPPVVGEFYAELARVEARHGELYLDLAASVDEGWRARLAELATIEADLVTAPDSLLRFHSGPLRDKVSSS
jgi:tRNA-(ms[2]io[6]A)-hydroxylase